MCRHRGRYCRTCPFVWKRQTAPAPTCRKQTGIISPTSISWVLAWIQAPTIVQNARKRTPKDRRMTGETKPASIMIRSELLVTEISEHGAELIRRQARDGTDLLWNGSKEWWTGAPLLFPIVGKLPDTATFDGEPFPMRQHGFARNKPFSVVGASFLLRNAGGARIGSLYRGSELF